MDGAPGTGASDADLVERTRAGHDEAFGVLMRRHERRIYNLCYRMMGGRRTLATQPRTRSCPPTASLHRSEVTQRSPLGFTASP